MVDVGLLKYYDEGLAWELLMKTLYGSVSNVIVFENLEPLCKTLLMLEADFA